MDFIRMIRTKKLLGEVVESRELLMKTFYTMAKLITHNNVETGGRYKTCRGRLQHYPERI